MNELEIINNQLNEINNKRVKYQTLMEQSKKVCERIESKYNIKSAEELKKLVDEAQLNYQNSIAEAKKYIEETNQILSQYNGVL